jgi:hypothetical protein
MITRAARNATGVIKPVDDETGTVSVRFAEHGGPSTSPPISTRSAAYATSITQEPPGASTRPS